MIRHGLFRPWFELTDGQFCYGKLSYRNFWKTTVVLETANKTWVIKRKGIFSRSLLIEGSDGFSLGTITPELWSRKINLSMNNGFEAVYLNKKFFTRVFNLTSSQYGDILSIKIEIWAFKTPFKVSVDLDKLKSIPDKPLLTLTGINLILMKQAQAASAARS